MRGSVVTVLVTAALAMMVDARVLPEDALPFVRYDSRALVLCEVVREVKAATCIACYDILATHLANPRFVRAYESVRAVRGVGRDLVERAFAEKADMLYAHQKPVVLHQIWQFMAYHEEVFTALLYRDLRGVRDLTVLQVELREEREARERLHAALDRMAWDILWEGEAKRTEFKVHKDPCKVVLEGEAIPEK